MNIGSVLNADWIRLKECQADEMQLVKIAGIKTRAVMINV